MRSPAEEQLDRYFQAFENGTMAEAVCGARIAALDEHLKALRGREAELTAAIESPEWGS